MSGIAFATHLSVLPVAKFAFLIFAVHGNLMSIIRVNGQLLMT